MPQDILNALADDAELGSGNYLHYAARLNPNRDRDLVFLDHAIEVFGVSHQRFSAASLKRVTDEIAAWYLEAGVGERDPVAIYVDNNFKNSLHFLALTAIGAVPILVNGNVQPHIAALFIERAGAVGLVCDPGHYDWIRPHLRADTELGLVVCDRDMKPASTPLPAWYPYRHHDDDPVLVCHSSGTTGIPKAVTNYHQQYFFGPRYRMKMPLRPGPQRALSAFPHSHSAGVSFPMRSIIAGTPIMIVSDQSAENILRCIDAFQPTTVGAFAEHYAKMSKCDLGGYRLDSVQTWLNTGDSAHEAHIRPLVNVGSHYEGDRLVPGSVFVDGLGSSEMGYSMFKKEHTKDGDSYGRCVGRPFEFVEAAILGEHGEVLGPNQVGMIGFKAPSITPGYWNNSVVTYRAQRSGYWMPGDVGFRNDDGEYFHLDRAVDVIHSADGPAYTLPTEEKIQNRYPELADASVIGVDDGSGHKVAIAFVWGVSGDEELDAGAMLEALNRDKGNGYTARLSALAVVSLDEIPLGATGKVLKRELREKFQNFLVDEKVRAGISGQVALV
ncbi:class I adenylate-forming enzyme family protein [Haliangium sp.]